MSNYTLMQLKQTSTPTQFSHHLREMGDIFWWEGGKFFVVTSYGLAKKVLLSEDYSCDRKPFFITRMPELNLSLIQDFFKVVGNMMVMSDAPEHTRRRRICYQGFTSQAINHLIPLIQQTITDCFNQFACHESFDFVNQLAQVIPSTTLAELFAIPEAERLNFYHWSDNMTQFFGGSSAYQDKDGIQVNHSAKQLYAYFAKLIDIRRHTPGHDFLSILLQHQAHFGLNDEEIISQAIMMLVAGQVTTTDQMCNNLYTFLTSPPLWQTLQNDLEHLEAYLEEANRLDPAVTFIFRVCKKDTQLGKQKIKKGSVIFISTHAVNRDPHYFANPDDIDIQQNKNQPISYGYGSHFCLGAKLARLEMHEVFKKLLQAYPNLKLDQKYAVRKHHSLSFSGFETLRLCK